LGDSRGDGKLDSERSNFVRVTVAEDQLIVYASTSRRLRQPNDLGVWILTSSSVLVRPECPRKKVSMVKDTYRFISPDKSPTQFIDSFRQFYGPTMNAFDAAQNSGKVKDLPV
jgi:hypothetical protein